MFEKSPDYTHKGCGARWYIETFISILLFALPLLLLPQGTLAQRLWGGMEGSGRTEGLGEQGPGPRFWATLLPEQPSFPGRREWRAEPCAPSQTPEPCV